MFLCDIGPVYIKCGIIIGKESEFIEKISSQNSLSLLYLNLINSVEFENKSLFPFKINLLKISKFEESYDYKLIKEFIFTNLINICHYCGKIDENTDLLINKLFGLKCVKNGHVNQLSIYGLDYISKNIKNAFFYLPGQKISNLIKVGHGLDEVTQKNYIEFQSNLFPFVMANILEGTSVYRVDSSDNFKRIGGSTMGTTTYWSLVKLACGYDEPEIAVRDAIKGNNELIDLSVGDIYGKSYDAFNLDSALIASSFGKLKYIKDMTHVDKQDISRSLMTLLCVTSSQITANLAYQSGVDKVIILGNPFECLEFMQMIQMAINYFSKEKIKVYFSDYAPYINLIGMSEELIKQEKRDSI